MKKITVFIILIIIIFVGVVIWYFYGRGNNNQLTPSSAATTTSTGTVASSSTIPVASAVYLCDGGKTINAAFYRGEQIPVEPGQPPVPTGSVKVVLSDGRSFDLLQTISADGGRYANGDESFVFWDKGDTAPVLENGVEKDYIGCIVSAE